MHYSLVRQCEAQLANSNQDNPPVESLYVPITRPKGKIIFVGMTEDALAFASYHEAATNVLRTLSPSHEATKSRHEVNLDRRIADCEKRILLYSRRR